MILDHCGGVQKVPGFNLRDLNCCLTLKFGVCIESYVQLAKIRKKFKQKFENDREIKLLKKFKNFFVITKMSAEGGLVLIENRVIEDPPIHYFFLNHP